MSELINILSYEGEGIDEVYDNGKWLIAIKNWREANTVEKVMRLEIHHTTDQQFMLIHGKACLLLAPTDMDDDTVLKVQPLEIGKVFSLPKETWFNNVLSKDCKLMYVEGHDAIDNSEYRPMSDKQRASLKELVGDLLD
ncbi:MAG: cupin [Lachnospiraceae bacterium]|nr:cupin [Lachnospiraceae bacterium]